MHGFKKLYGNDVRFLLVLHNAILGIGIVTPTAGLVG
jgi:hypothetical protein